VAPLLMARRAHARATGLEQRCGFFVRDLGTRGTHFDRWRAGDGGVVRLTLSDGEGSLRHFYGDGKSTGRGGGLQMMLLEWLTWRGKLQDDSVES
jgi:hypothetical protein